MFKSESPMIVASPWRCISVLCLLLFTGLALAEVAPSTAAPIGVTLLQFRVREAPGKPPVLEEVAEVRPGDLVEYRARYVNNSAQPMSVIAGLPIPIGMEYTAASARADRSIPHVVAQADEKFAAEPLETVQTDGQGKQVRRPVPYDHYRHVRWDLGALAPGANTEVSLQARVVRLVLPTAAVK